MTAPVLGTSGPGAPDGLAATLNRIATLQTQLSRVLSPVGPLGPGGTLTTGDFASALAAATAPDPSAGAAGATGVLGSVGTAGPTGADVVTDARSYLGVPYVFAGTTRSGLDCSGLVQRVYHDLGVSLPRIAADQAHVGTAVPSLAQAQPGDILAFGDPAYHVALYIGGGKMIAAPEPGDVVKVQDVYTTPSTIRRVFPAAGPAAGVAPAGATGAISPAVRAWSAQFAAAEARNGLPAGLLSAVAQTESGGNTAARSPAGALGLMQFMPSTAAAMGINPLDPAQAIDGAARLLAGHLQRFGSVPLALAAYNAGSGAVSRYGGIPPYPETQNYVRRITGLMGIPA